MFHSKIIASKTYAYIFFIFMAIIFSYHLLIYNLFTSQVLNVQHPMYVGDLSRISYQVDSIDLRKAENTLERQHLEGSEYHNQNIDMITIGDSFSNGGGSGKNAFYQDYIASINNLDVLNIRALDLANGNVPNTLLALNNSGLLDKVKPKIVLLSIGSRALVRRFSHELDWEAIVSEEAVFNELKHMKPRDLSAQQLKNVSIVNTANFKYPFFTLGYHFKPCLKSVCKFPLKKPLFSVEADKEILIYKQTLKDLHMNTPENIKKANNNLNRLAQLLTAKGIKLYFMPAVSKYDLYYEYIDQKKFPKDPLFDLLTSLQKDYILINTKDILLPLLKAGEKDLFYADDTHWSSKASKEIFTKTPF